MILWEDAVASAHWWNLGDECSFLDQNAYAILLIEEAITILLVKKKKKLLKYDWLEKINKRRVEKLFIKS